MIVDFTAHLPALQVIVPLLMAPFVVLLQPRGLAWAATTASSLVSFAMAIALADAVLDGRVLTYEMGGWAAPYGIALSVGSFGALLLLVVNGASMLALLGGRASIDRQIAQDRQAYFYSAWLLAQAGLIGILVSADAFNIFVFMEISSLASYILIAGGPDRRSLPAVFKYLIMGTMGATFYLIGVGLVYMMTGTLNLADMEVRVAEVNDIKPVLVAAGFITLGLALKGAVFPLHVWLPNAYTHSPHMVTVFLAACATKVSIYVLIRFDFFVFQANLLEHANQFSLFLMPLAVLGILVASAVAVFEGHIKRLFAASSVAQIGYVLLGASMVSIAGLSASLTHMFNHALAKGGMFMAIACLAYHYKDLRLEELRGVARTMPWTAAALLVCGMSLIGMPGTAGFISKWLLVSAALEIEGWGWLLVVVILAGSLMSLAYIWRIIESVYFSTAASTEVAVKEAPAALLACTLIVALLNIIFGFFPALPVGLANNAAELLMGHTL